MKDILTALQPYLIDLLVVLAGAIGTILAMLTLKAKAWIVARIGGETYNQAVTLALGIWHVIEDAFPELSGSEKAEKMQWLLLQKFPGLTQVELDAINKWVHSQVKTITAEVSPAPTKE